MKAARIPWFSLFVVLSAIALQALTFGYPATFPELQRHLALEWGSLERFELYRLLSSPFLQTSPGFSRTVIGLTAVAVPVWELRAGPWRACATFFAGDWLSTLPTLFALKTGAVLGSASAAHLLVRPDSGSSSGGFACLGAFTATLSGWPRLLAVGGLGGFVAIRLVGWHRLFDFQHGLAACVGVAAVLAVGGTGARGTVDA